jgi:hypothetical protein
MGRRTEIRVAARLIAGEAKAAMNCQKAEPRQAVVRTANEEDRGCKAQSFARVM